jgi:hypothetical protein
VEESRYLKAQIKIALMMATGGMRRTRIAWLNAVAAPADWAEATALHIEHWANRGIGAIRNTDNTESSIQ